MKYIQTFESFLFELESLKNYDALTYLQEILIDELERTNTFMIDGTVITEKVRASMLTEVLVKGILDFYEVKDNSQNRKTVERIFSIRFNAVGNGQLHINNRKRDFENITSRAGNPEPVNVGSILSTLIEEIERLYPDWAEQAAFKKSKLLPYQQTAFTGTPDAKIIYEWDTTFETLKRVIIDYLHNSVEDEVFNKYSGLINSNMEKLENYVKENNYGGFISSDKTYPNIGIAPLVQKKIYNKKYFTDWLSEIQDAGVTRKFFDTEFSKLLSKLIQYVKK